MSALQDGGRPALLVHPAADPFPAMSESEFHDLRESIRANGIREPVLLHRDGRIIDGRHRARAAIELGISYPVRRFDGPDADIPALVLDLNLKRRHLDASQRAMLVAALEKQTHGGDRRSDQNAKLHVEPRAGLAKLASISPRSVGYAAQVRHKGIPELIAAAEAGKLPVNRAARLTELSPERQRQAVERICHGVTPQQAILSAARSEKAEGIERASAAVPLARLGRKFPILYADPPWQFEAWSSAGMLKAAEMHYPTLPIAEICALPVGEIAARDAVLFLWALSPMLPEALDVVRAWGFQFKTFMVWVKDRQSCGHWCRNRHEPLIIATRGDMPPPARIRDSVFEMPTSGRHSEKPAGVRDWIASAYPDVGRIELFAREATPGWTAWGHEAPQQELRACTELERMGDAS